MIVWLKKINTGSVDVSVYEEKKRVCTFINVKFYRSFLQRFEQPTSPAPTHEISGKTSNNLITSTPGPMKSTIMIKPLHLSGVSEISSSESELGRNSV